MGIVSKPLPVKLFTGILAAKESLILQCETLLEDIFGPIDLRGTLAPWDHSDYYSAELGQGILRNFVFFRDLIDPEKLPAMKLLTNRLEQESSIEDGEGSRRKVNIDPGYLTEAKVVLASTKDYSHRMYLGQGIYGEVELRYSKDLQTYVPVEHSYPDFRNEGTIDCFKRARAVLHAAIRDEAAARQQQRQRETMR